MTSTPILSYRRGAVPTPSGHPEPGILINVAALVVLIVSTATITTVLVSGMWASDPDWGLVRAVTLIALAGALLLLEFRAYFCNSVIASTLVGLVFSILDLVLLAWISHIALVDEISFHAIVDRLDLASVVFILILISMGACPAIGHFAWARELERWARLRASFEQGSEIRI